MYADATNTLAKVTAKAAEFEEKIARPGQLRIYAPIEDLALAHMIVDEFGGMEGLARELRNTYDEAPVGSALRARILKNVMDFVQTISSRGLRDTMANLPDIQKDLEERAQAIMQESLQSAKTQLGVEQ